MLHLALIQAIPPFQSLVLQALLFVALLGFSAFMSGSEIALLSFSKIRRLQLVDEGHSRIQAVEKLLDRPERLLISVLVLDTTLNVAATVLVTLLAAQVFSSWVAVIAIGFSTLLLLTFGEIAPKAFAARHNERWALAVAPTLVALERVLLPVVVFYEWMNKRLFRAHEQDGGPQNLFRSEEEIKTLITMGAEEGVLERKEEDMLHSVIEFAATTAREIMVPRIDMTAVTGDATLDQVRAFILESGYSRVPVYQGTLDNVVGVLYVKDLLVHYVEKRAGTVQVKELMREPLFVPESKKLNDLLSDMREKRVHMAIVIDEFGGTAGMVTMEDVIEEIVGDIFDEGDLRQDPVRKVDALTAIVDARTHVADVNRALELEIPEDEGFDTVAGYVYHKLGRLGKEGEIVHGPGFDMVVEKVTNRRILRVRFVKHEMRAMDEVAGGEAAL